MRKRVCMCRVPKPSNLSRVIEGLALLRHFFTILVIIYTAR